MKRLTYLVLASSLLCSPAWAAKSKADQLFEEGRAAMSAGDYATACSKFEASKGLDPAPSTVLNLGLCHEKQGHFMVAIEHFKNAALAFGKGGGRAEAEKRAAESEKQLAIVTVGRGPTLPEGARIALQGKQLKADELGAPHPMDPGPVELSVDADGHEHHVITAQAEPGASLTLTAVAGDALAQKTVVKTEVRAGGSPLRTAGFVVGGVGVASLIVGGITGALALGKAGVYRDACDRSVTPNVCDQRGYDAAQSLKTLTPLSTITFIAGGALVAGGVTMILLAPKASREQPRPARLRVDPWVGPGLAAASLSYSFQ